MKRAAVIGVMCGLVCASSCISPETAVLRLHFDGQPIIGDEIAGVGDLWEIDSLAVSYGDGAITVKPRPADRHPRSCGFTDDKYGCTPTFYGCQFCSAGFPLDEDARAICLAHETGHVGYLGHVDDPTNVMHWAIGRDTTETTDEQRAAVRERAAWLELCP